MAITAIRGMAPTWYTPEREREEENPARFRLRPLTPPEFEQVIEIQDDMPTLSMARYSDILRMGLVDWEGVEDEHGKPLRCLPVNHARLPIDLRAELAGEILSMSTLTDDDEKN